MHDVEVMFHTDGVKFDIRNKNCRVDKNQYLNIIII